VSAGEVIEALRQEVDALPRGLRDHVLRVVDEAQRLARAHGIDEERATIAALGHDLMRGHSPAELLHHAEASGLAPSAIERSEAILLHGPLSARLMAGRFAISDADALAAARHHTTARAGMAALERLIYVADKIEPEKARLDPALARARELAADDLDAAMRVILDRQVARAVERGWPLHPDTVAARNELLDPAP
jgi:predicted HD superfamily hydrolase involved in NAD metabolism